MGNHERGSGSDYLVTQEYGAGDAKIGSIVGGDAAAGKRIKKSFMRNVPAYKYLKDKLELQAKRGWVPALDGGKLHVRSAHKALNVSLQSAGALIAKQWGLLIDEYLEEEGLIHGVGGDYYFCVFSHDEYQIAARDMEVAQKICEVGKRAVKEAEKHFEYLCPLDCEFKIGLNWADTH